MRYSNRWMVVVLIIACLQVAACAQSSAPVSKDSGQPARVEHIAGTGLNRVILTAEAAKRIDIQTTQVRDALVGGTLRKVVPYAAVIYDLQGGAWVYTNPEPLTYIRAAIRIDFIDSDLAVLSDGPPYGTEVVTVGGPELYGTEFQGGLQP